MNSRVDEIASLRSALNQLRYWMHIELNGLDQRIRSGDTTDQDGSDPVEKWEIYGELVEMANQALGTAPTPSISGSDTVICLHCQQMVNATAHDPFHRS